MAEVVMPSGEVILIDEEEIGKVSEFKWSWAKIRGGPKGYALTKYRDAYGKRKSISMHRLIMGHPKGLLVDHISGNTLDNRKSNLRVATISQNRGNSKLVAGTKSGLKGARFIVSSNNWRATITINGKWMHLGMFRTAKEAHEAYMKAAIEHFGEFANAG